MIRAAMIAVIASGGLLALTAAAAPVRDGAVIVDSGSTNTSGYRIDVWSDGRAVLTLQDRMGNTHGAPKSFRVKRSVAARLFADLKAARDGNAKGEPCMKSASFGTTTRVSWHAWNSPDLDCPGDNPLVTALVRDLGAIRSASGVDTMLRTGVPFGPPHVQILPPASSAASPSPSPGTER
jgi:hypothetical protein